MGNAKDVVWLNGRPLEGWGEIKLVFTLRTKIWEFFSQGFSALRIAYFAQLGGGESFCNCRLE